MKIKSPLIIYIFFFFSGAAGLIYEIVWGRMFVIIFGSTTNSLVAVISAFLSGLALGSMLFAKLSDRQPAKKLLRTYSFLEAGVGLSALSTLFLFPLIEPLYSNISDGSSVTFGLILVKFVMTFFVLILPTILMGATLPVLTNFIKSYYPDLGKNISMLYAVNTFGAVFGAGEAAFFLIEYAGLRGTLYTAAAINIMVAFFAFIMRPKTAADQQVPKEASSEAVSGIKAPKRRLIFFVTGLSGMVAIAYQILWTRILTPATGTFIYAFAEILMIYLLGIAFGSLVYNNFLNVAQRRNIIFAVSELLIGFFALSSVFVTSLYARAVMDSLGLSMEFLIMATMLPAALFMGISFPAAIDSLGEKEHHGNAVGSVYFYNTIGSIAGGFLASFFFIPFIGSTQSIILLAGINFFLAILLVAQGRNFLKEKSPKVIFAFSVGLMIFGFGLFFAKGDRLYEAGAQEQIDYAKAHGVKYLFKEDETGSVFAYNDGKIARLIVDGIGMTGKDRETKMMAHVPISIHKDPKDMLAICFGMGTTFRSALKDGLNVDAVELSRAVADSFSVFYSDTQSLLSRPNARIIVNDGRNYISLTSKKYDIIAIDPPPPFNSAGTTVLYSEDFYRELAKKLKPGGLLNQWIYFNSNEDDIGMAVKSFLNVFPYAMAYYVPNNVVIGIDLVGSFSPIEVDPARVEKIFSSDVVKNDLAEFGFAIDPSQVMDLMIADRNDLMRFAATFPPITDDRPRTEYFLNRHSSQKYSEMTIEIFRKRIGK